MNEISKGILPKHVAIIPDGNRRWARKRNMAPWRGHLKGAERTREQLQIAFDMGLKCLSWWGGSFDNLTKRSKIEVNNLFRIYQKYFKQLKKEKQIHQDRIKVSVIGRWQELLPKSGIKAANDLIEATKEYDQGRLNFLIGYNGTDEMLEAIKNIVKQSKTKNLRITSELLRKNLWTKDLPPVDLLIRTGSCHDPHNSAGFMMWLTADSQLYFSKELYPDFGKKEFIEAILEFQKRERRLGK
jgi:tritrans,polycis-undecaprenyl-diphosphate synthase [geranylgeranyl-diphosphate specific]